MNKLLLAIQRFLASLLPVSNDNITDYKTEIEKYSEIIKNNPNDADAYYNRGNVKVDSRDFKGAVEDLNKAKQLNPSWAREIEVIIKEIT